MANENNEDVKEFVERIDISGSNGGDDSDDEEVITSADSSPERNDDGDEESEDGESESDDSKKPDELVKKPAPVTTTKKEPEDEGGEVEGETPRERALRLQVTLLRKKVRAERVGDLNVKQNATQGTAKPEMSPEKKKVLERYKPEEIQSLKEVFDVMADDMGFVRKDQLGATTYTEKAGEELDKFIEAHPEYLPENDTDNVLWDAFKAEYALYKQPENPKDFKKIFEKVHRDVFGIKPAGENKTINAAKEKIKVASHSGSSKPATPTTRAKAPSGLRLDMLKGFTDEERAELENGS